MFKTKEIGKLELKLITKQKNFSLSLLARSKKVFFYGILIVWSILIFLRLILKVDADPLLFFAVVLPLIQLWIFLEDYFKIKKDLNGINHLLENNQINYLAINSERFYQLEELHDLGEYYIFEVAPNKLVFFGGQEFYPTRNFPNSNFEIIEGKDAKGNLVIFEILKKGKKIKPLKKLKGKECEKIFDIPEFRNFGEYIEIEGNLKLIDDYL